MLHADGLSVQVNIDFENEQDMVEKMRTGLALQPIATALFSNSPFRDGQDTGAAWNNLKLTPLVFPLRTPLVFPLQTPNFSLDKPLVDALQGPLVCCVMWPPDNRCL